MEFFDAIRGRQSIRVFKQRPVSKEIIQVVVDAGRLASTARNVQPWHFVATADKRVLFDIANIVDNAKFAKEASAVIAVFSDETKYYLEDCSAATENMLLAAFALGLGGCWVAGDKKDYCRKIQELFEVPEDKKLVSMIILGHPEDDMPRAEKRSLGDVLHWEKW